MAVQYKQEPAAFGTLLRHHRVIAGLSQEALAERAGLSTRAISDLERGVKNRPHPATMRALADALSLESTDRAALAAASRPGSETSRADSDLPALPVPVSRMIGRDGEFSTARQMLQAGAARLLTLTGPGGVGKTRLSLELARSLIPQYADGVVFVELAAVTECRLVAATIASALGLREVHDLSPAEAILAFVQGKQALLVLDNCEHVLDGVRPLVAEIVALASGVQVLGTSRSPLHLRGEQVLPIPPFDVPILKTPPPAGDLSAIPAIDLFVERARAVRPNFALTERNAEQVGKFAGSSMVCPWRSNSPPARFGCSHQKPSEQS